MSEASSLHTNPLKTNDTPSWRRSPSTHSGQHIVYQSGYSRSDNNGSLVNTSLPAKEAPPLPPKTLASLTSLTTNTSNESTTRSFSSRFSEKLNLTENKSTYKPLKPKTANLSSDQEFPSLSTKNTPRPTSTPTPNNNYATLARTWGQQKKEDDEKTKKQTKEEADKKHQQQKQEEAERRFYKLGVSSIHSKVLHNRNESDDEKYDLGNNNNTKPDDDYDSYESPTPDEYEDESDDDDDDDDTWNRRNKHDLY